MTDDKSGEAKLPALTERDPWEGFELLDVEKGNAETIQDIRDDYEARIDRQIASVRGETNDVKRKMYRQRKKDKLWVIHPKLGSVSLSEKDLKAGPSETDVVAAFIKLKENLREGLLDKVLLEAKEELARRAASGAKTSAEDADEEASNPAQKGRTAAKKTSPKGGAAKSRK